MEVSNSSPRRRRKIREDDGAELFNAVEVFDLPISGPPTPPRPMTAAEEARMVETWERAFGHIYGNYYDHQESKLMKDNKASEFREQMRFATWMIEHYPRIRFYSSLNGFNLTTQWGKIGTVQWATEEGDHKGYPDLFVYKATKSYSMLVIELKKKGVHAGNDEHTRRQRAWLDYLAEECGAFAVFASGIDEAIDITLRYLGDYEQKKDDHRRPRAARELHNEDSRRQPGRVETIDSRRATRHEDLPHPRQSDSGGFVRAVQGR